MDLDRRQLEAMDKTVLRPGSAFEAEVALYESNAGAEPGTGPGAAGPGGAGPERFVVKDSRPMHGLVRSLLGRRVKRREMKAYRTLDGIAGVPALVGRIDRDAFAIEFVPGRTLARGLDADLLERALADLGRVLREIHARRIVHLDLKQKRNVIIGDDGSAAIIDFESALRIPAFFPGDSLLALLKRRDEAGLIKFKAKYAPHLLTPGEKRIADREERLAFLWPFKRIARFFRRLGCLL